VGRWAVVGTGRGAAGVGLGRGLGLRGRGGGEGGEEGGGEGGEGRRGRRGRRRRGGGGIMGWGVWQSGGFRGNPDIPRPIVSMHVRQGDKAIEMQVFGFEAYMAMAYRIKKLLPGTRNIWLSTEQQVRCCTVLF